MLVYPHSRPSRKVGALVEDTIKVTTIFNQQTPAKLSAKLIEDGFAPPTSGLSSALVELFRVTLGGDAAQIGDGTNFFSAGGTSLKVSRKV